MKCMHESNQHASVQDFLTSTNAVDVVELKPRTAVLGEKRDGEKTSCMVLHVDGS